MVLGHEFSGIVQNIKKNKYKIKKGDRVTWKQSKVFVINAYCVKGFL